MTTVKAHRRQLRAYVAAIRNIKRLNVSDDDIRYIEAVLQPYLEVFYRLFPDCDV